MCAISRCALTTESKLLFYWLQRFEALWILPEGDETIFSRHDFETRLGEDPPFSRQGAEYICVWRRAPVQAPHA